MGYKTPASHMEYKSQRRAQDIMLFPLGRLSLLVNVRHPYKKTKKLKSVALARMR